MRISMVRISVMRLGVILITIDLIGATLVGIALRDAFGEAVTGQGRIPETDTTPRAREVDPLPGAFPLSFDSERIRLYIVGDSLEVRGTYFLLCSHPTTRPISLVYPFPVDSMLAGARMVSLSMRAVPGEAEPARWDVIQGGRGALWWFPPCTGDTIVAESVYRQKLLGGYARYIVTTTRYWDHPLRRARFEIHLPPATEPTEFSFPFAKRIENGELFYTFDADSFFPDRDIAVRWKH